MTDRDMKIAEKHVSKILDIASNHSGTVADGIATHAAQALELIREEIASSVPVDVEPVGEFISNETFMQFQWNEAFSPAPGTKLYTAPPDAASIRRAAIEECAKVCEAISDQYREREGGKWPECRSDAETGASDCENAIRALLDKEPAPVSQWQPIASASCTRKILLWWKSCKTPCVGKWRCDEDEGIPINQSDCTHWMPLPAAPEGAAK